MWGWALLVFAAVAGGALVSLYSWLIGFRGTSTCYQAPDPVAVAAAQRELTLLAAVAWAPWLLASLWLRPRLRVVLAGLVCASPAIVFVVNGALNSQAYRGEWCF